MQITSIQNKNIIMTRLIEIELVTLPVFILILSAIGFFFGISIQSYSLWLCFFLVFLMGWIINKNFLNLSNKTFILSFIIFLFALAIFFSISSLLLSSGWDGFAYHQPTIILLAKGWNPFAYWNSQHWIATNLSQYNSVGTDAYGLAGEIIAAAFYKAAPIFEGSKCYNFIYILLIMMLGYRFFKKFSLSKKQLFLIIIPLALNPIASDQAWVFYIDGQVASLITLLVLLLLDGIVFSDFLSLIEAGGIFIILSNIKLTGIVFACFIVAGFFLYLIIYKREWLSKYFFIFLGSFIIAFAVVGYQPYLRNTIDHLNPFYVVISSGYKAAFLKWQNASFLAVNRFEQFFISLFANNFMNFKHFASDKFILFPQVYDAKTMAYGFIFGYLFVASLILFFFIRHRIFRWTSLIILISLFLFDGAWLARIVPQAWLFPLIVLVGVLLSRPSAIMRKIITPIMVLLCINALAIFSLSTIYEIGRMMETKNDLKKISRQHQVLFVDKSLSNIAEARIINQAGIQLKIKSNLKCKHFIRISRLMNTKFCLLKDVM